MQTLVIAGATGFVGRWFIDRYRDDYHIIALSRSAMQPDSDGTTGRNPVEWRQVEMYSITSVTQAVTGADYALYLVHSMEPNTRLHQGSFEDMDLLLADNFARAAEKVGLRQIVFMGGILPHENLDELSRHLRSRYEVEMALGATGVPVTALRAGIIVGPGGSSFLMIKRLIERLPVLLCPEWTRNHTQPIALQDALRIIEYCLGRESTFSRSIDIGGSEVTTYMGMMVTTNELMGKNRIIRPVPFFSAGLSKMWVSLFTGYSQELTSPLVESLRHRMVADDNDVLAAFPDRMDFRQAAAITLRDADKSAPVPRRLPDEREKNTVRSVQRLPNPMNRSAPWVARMYQAWLPRFFRYLIRVESDEEYSTFSLFGIPLLKLHFIAQRSDNDRQLFYVIDGELVKRSDYGWLEFRRVLNGRYVITAIHEFVPALPWYVYVLTQARAHRFVMNSFGKFLGRRDGEEGGHQK
ncbi:MAG: NAD(P)H-binding protein [Saprospiraceae bacterium]